MPLKRKKVLIIKLGAMGDFVMTLDAMYSISRSRSSSDVYLLTIPSLKEFSQQTKIFKQVFCDKRNIMSYIKIPFFFFQFDEIFDLQANGRTNRYYSISRCLAKKSFLWYGSHNKSYIQRSARKINQHVIHWRYDFLKKLNISIVKFHMKFKNNFKIHKPYIVLVPGASKSSKLWNVDDYSKLARELLNRNYQVVLIGSKADMSILNFIEAKNPLVTNLGTKTTISDLFSLSFFASGCIGNDTGPIHIFARNIATLVLFLSTDAKFIGALGKKVQYMSVKNIGYEEVLRKFLTLMKTNNKK